jgi:hypothetical protein
VKSLASCEGAEDVEKTDVVFITEKCCNIDELASCDLFKRGDFLFLRGVEETGALGELAGIDRGGEVRVNRAGHETARDVFDRLPALETPVRFQLAIV